MFEWLWKRLGGATEEASVTKKGAATKKAPTKAKPTVAKTKAGSSLTAVRAGNTRPSSSVASPRKTKKGSTVVATTKRGSFDDMYDKLKAYKTANGHCNVPSVYEEDKTLANFVRRMRTQYKKIKDWEATNGGKKKKGVEPSLTGVALTKDQIKKLESIDFEWEAKRGRKTKGSHK